MTIDDLNPPERVVLQGTLQKDEELLWVGQPKPRLWTVMSSLLFFVRHAFIAGRHWGCDVCTVE